MKTLMVLFIISSTLQLLRLVNGTDIKQLETKILTMEKEIKQLKRYNQVGYGYCQSNPNQCGDCLCVDDFDLVQKFYCDCQDKPVQRDCKAHQHLAGARTSGVYRINCNLDGLIFLVFCDQTTDGGGWTVFQRRLDGSVNFQRNWTEYKKGFGRLHREHWLGNEQVYLLTAQAFFKGSEMRVDMLYQSSSKPMWAKYSNFEVDGEGTQYELHLSSFTGNVDFNGMAHHDGRKFTTLDRDNDNHAINCAQFSNGPGWHGSCNTQNLNGVYDELQTKTSRGKMFGWYTHRLQFSEMKLRRKHL